MLMPSVVSRCKSWKAVLLAVVASIATLGAHAQVQIGQQIANPAYYWPGSNGNPPWSLVTDWTPLNNAGPLAPSSVSPSVKRTTIAVANVINGPDYRSWPDSLDSWSPNWANVIQDAHAKGIKVLGYVDSGVFGATIPGIAATPLQTRLRTTGTEEWRTQIEHDIKAWYDFYGSNIDGIFFDQGPNFCGTPGASDVGTTYSDLYKTVKDFVKQNYPGAIVAINPGVQAPYCYNDAADILVTFEGRYNCYAGVMKDATHPDGCDTAAPPAGKGEVTYASPQSSPYNWPAYADPNKFWHLVYSTDGTLIGNAFALSKQRNAGYVYVAYNGMPNPWGSLPWDSYWSLDQSSSAPVNAGTTGPSAPTNLHTAVVSYTTATIEWNVATAANGVVGYDIYRNGTKVWSVTQPSTTPLTTAWVDLDRLQPNTAYTYTVRARDAAGLVSGDSNALTFTTNATGVSPPSAPGSLASSELNYSSVKLTWTASTGPTTVVAYDIYQDGKKVLTTWESATNGPATSARIIGLDAGHTGYAFTVQARDWKGNVSAASSVLNVNTPTLPGGSAIANPVGTYTSPNITYKADYLVPMGFHRVFIQSGNTSNACYAAGLSPNQMCADYMIEEGGNLMKYSGTSNGWAWTDTGVTPTYQRPDTTHTTYQWSQIPASFFAPNVASDQHVLFQGNGFWPSSATSGVAVN